MKHFLTLLLCFACLSAYADPEPRYLLQLEIELSSGAVEKGWIHCSACYLNMDDLGEASEEVQSWLKPDQDFQYYAKANYLSYPDLSPEPKLLVMRKDQLRSYSSKEIVEIRVVAVEELPFFGLESSHSLAELRQLEEAQPEGIVGLSFGEAYGFPGCYYISRFWLISFLKQFSQETLEIIDANIREQAERIGPNMDQQYRIGALEKEARNFAAKNGLIFLVTGR